MPGIFLRRDDGELVHLHGELYDSEDQLQELLEANPELLLGETGDSGGPSNYLLVRREAGVPEAQGGSDRGFLDHLFLDGEGVPTLVEVKRSSDSRIRREVVGQMLDYAANILAHWPPERMRDELEARCKHAGLEPAEKVREVSAAEYEAYWTQVKTNLAAKRLRLVFVADEIPASLQTIVEFLNEQLRAAEVLAVEVKQHKGDGVTVARPLPARDAPHPAIRWRRPSPRGRPSDWPSCRSACRGQRVRPVLQVVPVERFLAARELRGARRGPRLAR